MIDRTTARLWALRAAWWMAGLGLIAGAAAARVLAEGRSELAASDAAWAAGDWVGASVHGRAAARAYVPFSPHVGRAYQRLRAVAQEAEGKGDTEAALFAWRAIRAAAIGSRSIWNAHDRQRQVADAAIARLSASPGARDRADTTRSYAPALASDLPPRPLWGALVLAGAGLWAAAGYRLAIALRETREERARVAWPVALAAAGLVVFWAGLFWA
jgi:hypothetical protein